MALPKVLIAAALALAAPTAAAAYADGSFTSAIEETRTSQTASASAPSAQVDAPATLPLFAGALALLGWRMGRRRRR